MVDSQIAIFKRATLPDYCFVTEAVTWVAFAQIPVFQDYETRIDRKRVYVDFRGCQDAFDEGLMDDLEALLFWDHEFDAAGVALDKEKYNLGAYGYPGYLNVLTEIPVEEMASFRAETDAKIADAERYFQRSNEKLSNFVYPSWVKVHKAISSGRLSSRGWLIDEEKSLELGYRVGQLTDVHPNEWSLWAFRLDRSSLVTDRGEFVGVQVPTLDLIGLFPKPDCELAERHGLSFGDTVILNERGDRKVQSPPRSRGRPPKAQSSAKDVVARYFGNRILRGELPEKTEAALQQIIDFVSETFEHTISRTSAQTYLKAAKSYASDRGARN